MARVGNEWAVVLAAGAGTRLRSVTTDESGTVTPKQFCSLRGGRSLLGDAIVRARRVVPRERIVVIVAAEHERWWRRELDAILPENRIVQPRNQGTAAGVLLPLRSIVTRDPDARVLLVPSDHYAAREHVLAGMLREALDRAAHHSGEIVLLGMTPDEPEPEYGWIVPRRPETRPACVDAFLEKPAESIAARLLEHGALWNSFLVAADARALVSLYREHMPDLLAAFESVPLDSAAALAGLYGAIEPHDFSAELLQGGEERLRVLRVPPCGWTDLGTPRRVAACLQRREASALRREPHAEILDLAYALETMGLIPQTALTARAGARGRVAARMAVRDVKSFQP